jgi:hypothetical protein
MSSTAGDNDNSEHSQAKQVSAKEFELPSSKPSKLLKCGNDNPLSSSAGVSSETENEAPRPRFQGEKFEKRVAAFCNAKYSNRPQVVEGLDYVEPDLPGGAHLVVTGHGAAGDKYLGPKTAASPNIFESTKEALESMREANIITGIVNCTTHVPCYFRGLGKIKYCVIPVYDEDGADLLQYFMNATTFMRSVLCQGSSILVHCEVGVSRSSSVVMAYLIRFHGMSRDDAYLAVKKRRPKVNPNQGFWKQLQTFEAQLTAEPDFKPPLRQIRGEAELDAQRRLIQESYLLYTTCRDMESGITESNCFQWLFPSPSNKDIDPYYKRYLSLCVDLVWAHGVLTIDVEWLVFCCQQLWMGQTHGADAWSIQLMTHGADAWSIQLMVEDILTNPESDFVSAWEISPRQIQKVLGALDDSCRGGLA